MTSQLSVKSLLRSATRLACGAALALTLATATARAQATPGQGPVWNHPLVTAPTPFSWSPAGGLGPVKVQYPVAAGWIVLPNENLQFRFVQSLTGDPTIEAIFWPPASGHATQAERITFQFPMSSQGKPLAGALVIAFHSYGVSEKDIWINTDIASLCAERGWALVAPYGMVDTHYGNVQSQESLIKVLNVVQKYFKFDQDRIYTVGFSMGGGAATSFAMRHLSDQRLQVAAVVNHTGTQDLVEVYQNGSVATKTMLSDSMHFGTAPTTSDTAFPYLRVSPSRLVVGAVDPNLTPARNLRHIPMYTFVNLDDSHTDLVQDNLTVMAYLQGLGHPITLVTANKGSNHKWSTMDMNAAFRWLERKTLAKKPIHMEVFADKEIKYLDTVVRDKQDLRVARYDVTAFQGTNSLDVVNTRYLNSLFVDIGALGLDANLPLGITWSSIDSFGDEIVLPGYTTAPADITLDGVLHGTWTHDPVSGELAIQILPGVTSGVFAINP